ncbi:MAG: T9SS type A sorting domain-containing protein [Ignavibacteriae bacterium]|nr:T9SS type A sorting domain-containing protein [Ignavibacteriota bacterium]
MKYFLIIFSFFFSQLYSQKDSTTYQWPVPPLNSSQGITGAFAEFRNTGSSDHFHNAVDISEPDGNPVFPSMDGVVYSLDNNGYDSYINVKSIINGKKKHMTYYHVVPNPNLVVGQQVYTGLTVLGTIFVTAGHVHLIEREFVNVSSSSLGTEINPIRPEGGLYPFEDTFPPVIESSTLKFCVDKTNKEISSNQLYGKVDFQIKVREINGTNSVNVNNGTYILGYRILSENGDQVIYEPENNGVKYRFYFLPNDSYVHNVYVKNVATLSDPYYWVTNGKGENQINADHTVPNNYLDTDLLDAGNYTLEIFTEDTRGSSSSKRFPISVKKLPPKLKSVISKNDSIELKWEKYNINNLKGYRIYYSDDGNTSNWKVAADEKLLDNEKTSISFSSPSEFIIPSNKFQFYFYLTAIDSAGNESTGSDVYSVAIFSNDKNFLIVDGFSRYGNDSRCIEPQHSYNTFYFNSLISNNGSNISSCLDEVIANEELDLNIFDLVIWFTGDNSAADNTFVNLEQYKVALYLEQGGKILISGSNIGQDLDVQSSYSESSDTLFYHQYLKSVLMHDGLDLLNELHGEEGTKFSDFNSSFADAAPDDIEPINGGATILNYNFDYDREGLHRKGGVSFTGQFGESLETGQMIYFSFPFESIENEINRNKLMRLVLEYFNLKITDADKEIAVKNEFKLQQNFPNPFNPTTTIEYNIHANARDEMQNVELNIYDVLGRKVGVLVNQKQKSGNYKIEFDASNFSSGVYLYRLKTGNFIQTKKMILIK